MRALYVLILSVVICGAAPAAEHSWSMGLSDGKVQVPWIGAVPVGLRHLARSDLLVALNAALGKGFHCAIQPNGLKVSLDPAELPTSIDGAKQAVRVFTAKDAPDWTAAQQREWGLHLPANVDPTRRMVVLIHGLDCNRSNWRPMAELLEGERYQVAYFAYPSDGPIVESVALLAKHMQALRQTYGAMPLSIIAHSMGGLVARGYIEGNDYAGGVDHLILLGTPNQGSRWATYRIALEIREHWKLWRRDPNWRPTWMITDGLGEAGRDLRPQSVFLTELNARPRRDGVRYTVVAGTHSLFRTAEAEVIEGTASLIPRRARSWWGFRQTYGAMERAGQALRAKCGKSDGPVKVQSAKLQGVSDFVELPADHDALYAPRQGKAPAAWSLVRERLAR